MSEYRMLIGGELVAGESTMDVINSATEEVFAVCRRGSERQMNEAVLPPPASTLHQKYNPVHNSL